MPTFKKQFRIDFYHMECENGNFESFVNKRNKASFHRKVYHQSPYQIILDVFEDSPAYLCGNFIKVKMNDIDPKYNVSTYTTSSLDLSDDEGIPTGNVFLYLKNQQILFFQVAKSGISTGQFCDYFETYADTGKINLNFVLSEEGFRKLASFQHIWKIDVAIKGLDKGYALNQKNNSVKSVLKKFKDLRANNVKLEISKGNRKEGLSLNTAKEFVQDVFRIMQGESESESDGQHIQITGRESDSDDKSSIDLLITRYKRTIEIEVSMDSRLNSELHTNNKLSKLKDLVNSVGRDLNRLFGNNNGN